MKINLSDGPHMTRVVICTVDDKGKTLHTKKATWEEIMEGDKVMLTARYNNVAVLIHDRFRSTINPLDITVFRIAK